MVIYSQFCRARRSLSPLSDSSAPGDRAWVIITGTGRMSYGRGKKSQLNKERSDIVWPCFQGLIYYTLTHSLPDSKYKLVEKMLVANCDFSTFPCMEASF